MNSLKIIKRTIRTHPLTRQNRLPAWLRFVRWQITNRLYPGGVVIPFIESSKLMVKKGMHGATGNIYTGLQEFEDMAFLLHFLQPDELFFDVGANIGSYTILAAANARAKVIAVEPIPDTYYWLKLNCTLNNIEDRVTLVNKGLGNENTLLKFTSSLDTVNHVKVENDSTEHIEVSVTTADELLQGYDRIPVLMKMDVEGFELNVLQGGKAFLNNTKLQALIVEINGCCRNYGVKEEDIHSTITAHNFTPVLYDPFTREITVQQSFKPNGNTIYIRNIEVAIERVQKGRSYKVLNRMI